MRIPTFRAGRRVRTTAIALTVTAALAGGLTACSSDDSDSPNSSETGSASNQSDTIEIEHIMGTTEVPTNPETIASFSPAFTDAFAALGRPVDVEFRASGFDAEVPWSGEAPGTLESYSTGADGIGAVTEEIAAADPDVIFASWLPDEATYDKLNAIAPTVAVIGENPWTDDWRMSTEIAGEVIGKADEAKDLVADAEQAIADARDSHPALGGGRPQPSARRAPRALPWSPPTRVRRMSSSPTSAWSSPRKSRRSARKAVVPLSRTRTPTCSTPTSWPCGTPAPMLRTRSTAGTT
ncbi:MAG: ABC transporter substrate-binding protein [Corynebacterium sp.]|uniref:ABC transporter substrate-binding protein n=1 Tax=Corynebacterium sp. TaxID=1720 RepID=UPI002648BD53|nr:ABC transporter substrate-binding protein [Corynebacterium sp.]MDN5722962.1 ABC transporter substrate-binding protein [Corynebacterium sp.]MDN6281579.1 ABC transporter substrate-binding protein [Corynebacterium sp.]MDN6305128.1 ABC transporter substrate-binding protein [Corynebacterium sp.]MDN6353391.1 ABC transporter substrate-binding protein [Corynebacterium sp.]MDN6367361.1 ABC transporter substrate-binding protein [Corynebacterium sp.]